MMWVFLNGIEVVVMGFLSWFISHSNSIIAFFNIILIYFIFLQLRDARKPLITTKIIQRDKDVIDRPNVLESGTTLYLAIINNSKNIAQSINIEYQFDFNGRSMKVKEKELNHLNPKEATRIIIKYGTIRKKYPDLFEEKTEKMVTKIIPKETLKVNLIVTISYNPLIGSLFKYMLKDNYEIEWGSLKNYPNFRDHPILNCWNKRNGKYYIHKTGGREFREEREDSTDVRNEW
jgi:hypothetical protein